MDTLKRIALALVIIGAVNWGLIGLFQFDLVAAIFGGQNAALSRVVYTLVGLAGLYSLSILFDPMEEGDVARENSTDPGRLNYGTEFGEETHFSKRDDEDL